MISGSTSIVMLKNVGEPITVIRVMQQNEKGEVGQTAFEYELPLNFEMERIDMSRFTAVSVLQQGEFMGFYFERSVGDC